MQTVQFLSLKANCKQANQSDVKAKNEWSDVKSNQSDIQARWSVHFQYD